MKVVNSKIRVRYKETDQMGIAHHSNYYPWFEVGRTEFIRQMGLSYKEMENRNILLPVLETHCKYKKSAKFDDILTIRTWISSFRGVRLIVKYEVIRDEDGLLLAEGSTVHAFTDSSLKPINIKKHAPDIYNLFIKCLD